MEEMSRFALKELHSLEEMLKHIEVLNELYPSLTLEAYSNDLREMLPNNNYFQVAAFDGELCVGITGIWIGTKLWCGKYLEIDNLVVSEKYRSAGVGKLLFNRAEEIAKQNGCSMMALDSYTVNFQAHKFFYNEGFVPKGFHFIHVLDEAMLR
jgi:GNAT superfamily N-acetyltransferase